MREIKFRFYDEEDDVMRYFSLDDALKTSWVQGDFTLKALRNSKMQYTGFKDKYGEEIYEGDIVKCYAREKWAIETGIASKLILYGTGEVAWFEEECGFGIKEQDPTFLGWYECFEVIGNIYENPELLK